MVLASASPVRSRILTDAGVAHVCDPADVDEAAIKKKLRADGADVETVARALAEAKVDAVVARHPGAVVLGADQILELAGRWFDKPTDAESAARTLRALRGRTHRLTSAVAADRARNQRWHRVETARLTMREFSDDFLKRYIADGGDGVLTSVGAYRLEGAGAQLFSRIEGDYFTVLGLPLLPVLDYLRAAAVLDD